MTHVTLARPQTFRRSITRKLNPYSFKVPHLFVFPRSVTSDAGSPSSGEDHVAVQLLESSRASSDNCEIRKTVSTALKRRQSPAAVVRVSVPIKHSRQHTEPSRASQSVACVVGQQSRTCQRTEVVRMRTHSRYIASYPCPIKLNEPRLA